jgi:RND family efflux transporter MFP subunit
MTVSAPSRTPFTLLLVAWAAATSAFGCRSRAADARAEPEPENVVVTQWNDATELFVEYPPPVADEPRGNWAVHLTLLPEFQPVRSGTLAVRFREGAREAAAFTVDAPARPGIYLLDPVVERAGVYRVELELRSGARRSIHVLPQVRVHPTAAAVPRDSAADGGGIAFLKEQQWAIDFSVVEVREREIARTVSAPAELVPVDGAMAAVAAPVNGLALAGPNRVAPSVGERVREGEVLAVLAPAAGEDGFARTRAAAERLEREAARAERLYAAGAIPAKRLEQARHELGVARAELAAMGATLDGDYRYRVRAPLSGIVAERRFVPGGRVEAGDPLFTVIDPRRLWLRVRMQAADAGRLSPDATATFRVEGDDVARRTSRLVSVGSVLDPDTRTVPVVFEVENALGTLKVGHFARASVPLGEPVRGVAIPGAAVLDDAGIPVAYVQAGGETFERRILRLGADDGAHVQVLQGLAPGERVVVEGVYQVRLASMSDVPLSGGHAH